MFESRDVAEWKVRNHETTGRMTKRWLEEPSETDAGGTHWLFKESRENKDSKGLLYLRGEHWAEKVVSEIARLVGLPVVQVEIAHNGSTVGCIVKNVLVQDEVLIHGNELLSEIEHDEAFVAGHGKDAGHSLENIQLALAQVQPNGSGPLDLGTWETFVGYLVLDAVVSNSDRHPQNWGAVMSDGVRRLAPTFDHAASLGCELSAAERRDRLATKDNNFSIEGYSRRGKAKLEGRPTIMDAAVSGLKAVALDTARALVQRFEVSCPYQEIVDNVPEQYISQDSRTFASELLKANMDRLSSQWHASLKS